MDSPCLYEEMIEKGIGLSQKYQAEYKYVECYLDDIGLINGRLKSRDRMVSQIEKAPSEEAFRHTIENSVKPAGYKCLLVDTSKPLDSYINVVMNYIGEKRTNTPVL